MADVNPLLRSVALCTQLLQYWYTLPKWGRVAPNRTDIDPRQIDELLPHVFLAEVTRPEAIMRVTGGQVAKILGDPGQTVMRSDPFSKMFAPQSLFMAQALPAHVVNNTVCLTLSLKNDTHGGLGILLPLYSDSGNLDRIIGLIHMSGGAGKLVIESTKSKPLVPSLETPATISPLIAKDIVDRTQPTAYPHLRVVK